MRQVFQKNTAVWPLGHLSSSPSADSDMEPRESRESSVLVSKLRESVDPPSSWLKPLCVRLLGRDRTGSGLHLTSGAGSSSGCSGRNSCACCVPDRGATIGLCGVSTRELSSGTKKLPVLDPGAAARTIGVWRMASDGQAGGIV